MPGAGVASSGTEGERNMWLKILGAGAVVLFAV